MQSGMSSSRDPGLVDVDSRGAGRCIHRRGESSSWQAKGVPGVSQPKPLLARTSSPQQVGARARRCRRDCAAARERAFHLHPSHLAWSAPMISSAAPNVEDRVDAGITDGAAGQHLDDPIASGSRRNSTVDHSHDRRPFAIRVAGAQLLAAASLESLGSRHGRHSPQAHRCSKQQRSHPRKKRLSQGARAASARLTRSPQATRAGLASQCRSHR